MKRLLKNYLINRLLDFADFIYSCKPEGEEYSDRDKDVMKRIRKMRKECR